MAFEYKQGIYTPRFPHKYKGNVNNIVYRSGLEKKVMDWLDGNSTVLEWSSEEVIVLYRSPVDNRIHRYFLDFYVKAQGKDGTLKEMLIEVKPSTQCVPPQQPKRKTKKFLTEVMTYGVNQAKWNAAREYCKDRGWEFVVLTEKDIGVKYK